MLFAITFTVTDASEEGLARNLKLFTEWQPPQGLEFKAFYSWANSNGGIAIAEVSSAAALLEATAAFAPYLSFEAVPIVEQTEAVGLFQRSIAFRDSVR